MHRYLLFISISLIFIFDSPIYAQVSISSDGSAPNTSSMLEVKSTTKGLLLPRMLQNQRIAIVSPATSLMVFQTDGLSGFYYYTGNVWQYLNTFWLSSGANIFFPTGKVGINNVTPTRSLDVNGNVRIGTNGTTITNIIKIAITQTIGTIAKSNSVTINFAVPNASVTSSVIVSPQNALPNLVVIAYARVSSAGIVEARFTNFANQTATINSMSYYITIIE